jgi:hypothetical protein
MHHRLVAVVIGRSCEPAHELDPALGPGDLGAGPIDEPFVGMDLVGDDRWVGVVGGGGEPALQQGGGAPFELVDVALVAVAQRLEVGAVRAELLLRLPVGPVFEVGGLDVGGVPDRRRLLDRDHPSA